MKARIIGTVAVATLLFVATMVAGHDDAFDFPYLPYDHPAIGYPDQSPRDRITTLQQKIDSGAVRLDRAPRFGYLPAVLKELDINPDSQMLVFSKTSFQAPRISPSAPRAIYFSDDVSIGFVPHSDVMEAIAIDPQQGAIFYTLDRNQPDKPRFVRRQMECLQCHLSPATLNIPGLEISSVVPGADGSLRSGVPAIAVNGRTPLEQRWGGWFVTGEFGQIQSRANAYAPYREQPEKWEYWNTRNATTLGAQIGVNEYLEPTSDLVALMTIEHQTLLNNLFTRLNWEERIARQTGHSDEFLRTRLDMIVDQIVTYMLFADEAPLKNPVAGSSGFVKTFSRLGPRDASDRSLRDFDLSTRLFRYPLSYMIYSATFDALSNPARERIYTRLFAILNGRNLAPKWSGLKKMDRRAVIEIVRDTKGGLPSYWQ